MSRHNKANKNNYMQAGRLSPDDAARERQKMDDVRGLTADESSRRRRATRETTVTGRGEAAPSRRRSEREE